MFEGYYQDLFTIDIEIDYWEQTGATYPKLDEPLSSALDNDVLNEEINEATFYMMPRKAPGPDGFLTGFYQKSWSTVGECTCRQIMNL